MFFPIVLLSNVNRFSVFLCQLFSTPASFTFSLSSHLPIFFVTQKFCNFLLAASCLYMCKKKREILCEFETSFGGENKFFFNLRSNVKNGGSCFAILFRLTEIDWNPNFLISVSCSFGSRRLGLAGF